MAPARVGRDRNRARRVRGGQLGSDRAVAPAPAPFYGIGPLVGRRCVPADDPDRDVRPRAARDGVRAHRAARSGHGLDGEPFTVGAPDFGVAAIELEGGPIVRLTTSFYVVSTRSSVGSSSTATRARCISRAGRSSTRRSRSRAFGEPYAPVPLAHAVPRHRLGSRGRRARPAIRRRRPHRARPTCRARGRDRRRDRDSTAEGRPVDVRSSFARPHCAGRRAQGRYRETATTASRTQPLR